MLSVTPIVGHNYQLDVRQRFIAKMDTPEDPGLSNIKGMSGGPIWGVREGEEGGLEIRLVAIQSSWDRNYKVILGEYAMPFLNEIRGWLKTPETVS